MKKTKAFIKIRWIFLETLCLCWTSNSMKKGTNLGTDNKEDKNDTGNYNFNKQFIPHHWSTKFGTPEEVLQQFINFITTESDKATRSIPHVIDVRYGSSNEGLLDILGTDLPDDSPILVYIHGGNWRNNSKNISRFLAVPLHKAGIRTMVVGYDRGCDVTLWDMVDQVLDAILYVLNYAVEKGSRGVYLAGHGSGAHLIIKALSYDKLFGSRTIKKLNGVFLISGLYDFRNFSVTTANNQVQLTKADEIPISPLFNSYKHLEHSNVRFYILAAEEDSPTYKSQSRDFYDLLFDIIPMDNIYLEIKDDVDHYEIVKCLSKEDNYLKNLILHDLCKNS